MKSFLKISLIIISLLSTLNAAPARGGLMTFTQPDGTKFEGYLKGDAAFHWIESDSKVVFYNGSDHFYYNAHLNAKGNLVISSQKPLIKKELHAKQAGFSRVAKKESVQLNSDIKNALLRMQKESRKGHRPR